MVRTMVQLTDEQVKALKALAKVRKTSVAYLVRESVTLYVSSAARDTAAERRKKAQAIRKVAGKYRDIKRAKDLSINHDKYLVEAFSA